LALLSPKKQLFIYFLPIPFVYAFSFLKPIFYARYFSYLVIPLILLAVYGLFRFKKPVRIAIILLIVALSIMPLYTHYSTNMYSAFHMLSFEDGDQVLIHPEYEAMTLSFHFPNIHVRGIHSIPDDPFSTPFYFVRNPDYAQNETLFSALSEKYSLTLVQEVQFLEVYFVE
ncbi:MAG: hypothetical protein ACMXYA_01055, partial [Candidatus Woesearchaeota archaeon]